MSFSSPLKTSETTASPEKGNFVSSVEHFHIPRNPRTWSKIVGLLIVAIILQVVISLTAQVLIARSHAYESENRQRRVHTLARIGGTVSSVILWSIILLTVISLMGISIGPMLAAAGIVGIAVGFGAQTLVKDYFNGIFILMENQASIGDWVEVSIPSALQFSGVVQNMSLRKIELRDIHGVVNFVSNGNIQALKNFSMLYSTATMDIRFSSSTTLEEVYSILSEALHSVADRPLSEQGIKDLIIPIPDTVTLPTPTPPPLDGVQQQRPSIAEENQIVPGVITLLGFQTLEPRVFRISINTKPGQQWTVTRMVNNSIVATMEKHGIVNPIPETINYVYLSQPNGGNSSDSPAQGEDSASFAAKFPVEVVRRAHELKMADIANTAHPTYLPKRRQ